MAKGTFKVESLHDFYEKTGSTLIYLLQSLLHVLNLETKSVCINLPKTLSF